MCCDLLHLFPVCGVVKQAQPWWPRGYGAAKLYTLRVTFTADNQPLEPSSVVLKTGFRTVELVQDTMDNGKTNSN